MMDKEWEQMKKEQEMTRESLQEKGIPHIQITVFNDIGRDTAESPLTHTAFSMESLINTLLAMYTTTGGVEFVNLLAYTTSTIDNIHALTADMISDKLKSIHGEEGYDELIHRMKSFYDEVLSGDSPEEIPDAFKIAFEDEESEDE